MALGLTGGAKVGSFEDYFAAIAVHTACSDTGLRKGIMYFVPGPLSPSLACGSEKLERRLILNKEHVGIVWLRELPAHNRFTWTFHS